MKIFKLTIILSLVTLILALTACSTSNNVDPPGTQQQGSPEDVTSSPSNEASQEKQKDDQKQQEDKPDQTTNKEGISGIEEIAKLLPSRPDYQWSYHGFAEYGHRMTLEDISKEGNTIVYHIKGEVYDMSGGESGQDLSFSVTYIAKPDVLIQNKAGEAMMDTPFKDLELIRTPLQKGNSWLQETIKEDGETVTLKTTITDVREENGQKIYTVVYEDTRSEYYEKREIKEGVGVLSYEKLYMDPTENFTIGYYIYYPGTGYRNKLEINAYLPKLNTQLRYFGLAEYGHVGTLKEISSTSDDAIYEFQGMYQDGTGIDDQFTVRYYIDYVKGTVTEKVISSTRFNPPEVNSKLHNLVILKTPFKKGTTWSHNTKINGKEYKVTAEIKEYDSMTGKMKVTYTVKGVPGYFQNTYIEERVFERGRGMVGFSNLMPGDIPISEADAKDSQKLKEALINHMFGYSLNPEF
ncbi:MAG: hypothetical protein C0P72_005915 [Clostridia bacterium]|nr:hypothetical protein [Clostridia bacterium]